MMKIKTEDYFDRAFNYVVKQEGGYVNDPNDLGGETKFGISKRSYPNLDIKNLTLEEAKKIYYEDYWKPNKCESFPYWIAEKLFSLSINLGCKKAAKLLQRALMAVNRPVKEDGIIGPRTLAAVMNSDPSILLAALKSEAAGNYRVIAAVNKDQNKFLIGWLNRAYA